MTYSVKELFYTLQGEGANAGRPAVFCRFSGCNLWTGREEDRASAVCRFCDTDFIGTDGPGGGKFKAPQALATAARSLWPQTPDGSQHGRPFIVCTGGEPLLQLNEPLIDAFHDAGFEIAVETNGTIQPPAGIDWLCVSPKAEADMVVDHGQELKLVYPQRGGMPDRYETLDFSHFFLQPMDGPDLSANTASAVDYCKNHPKWRLSVQTHKVIGIP